MAENFILGFLHIYAQFELQRRKLTLHFSVREDNTMAVIVDTC